MREGVGKRRRKGERGKGGRGRGEWRGYFEKEVRSPKSAHKEFHFTVPIHICGTHAVVELMGGKRQEEQ